QANDRASPWERAPGDFKGRPSVGDERMPLHLSREGLGQPLPVTQEGRQNLVEKQQIKLAFKLDRPTREDLVVGLLNQRLNNRVRNRVPVGLGLLMVDELAHGLGPFNLP